MAHLTKGRGRIFLKGGGKRHHQMVRGHPYRNVQLGSFYMEPAEYPLLLARGIGGERHASGPTSSRPQSQVGASARQTRDNFQKPPAQLTSRGDSFRTHLSSSPTVCALCTIFLPPGLCQPQEPLEAMDRSIPASPPCKPKCLPVTRAMGKGVLEPPSRWQSDGLLRPRRPQFCKPVKQELEPDIAEALLLCHAASC